MARRYFNYSVEEWDALPWWQSRLYLDGLEDQGIINGKKGQGQQGPGQSSSGSPPPAVDYAGAMPLPRGFQTRRAG